MIYTRFNPRPERFSKTLYEWPPVKGDSTENLVHQAAVVGRLTENLPSRVIYIPDLDKRIGEKTLTNPYKFGQVVSKASLRKLI